MKAFLRKDVVVFVSIVIGIEALFTCIAAWHGKYHAEFRDMFPGGAWFTACFASFVGARSRGSIRDVVSDMVAVVCATALVIAGTTAVTQLMVLVFPATNTLSWLAFDWHIAALPFFLPPAVYAWSAAVRAIWRGVPNLGLAVMPFLMIWYVLANTHNVFGLLLRIPIVANPAVIYAYDSFSTGHPDEFGPLIGVLGWLTPDLVPVVLAAITVAGVALAVTLQRNANTVASGVRA